MPRSMVGLYPRLMRYLNETEYAGCVVMMLGREDRYILYVPVDMIDNEYKNIQMFERVSPSLELLEDYTGTVILSNNSNPVLDT